MRAATLWCALAMFGIGCGTQPQEIGEAAIGAADPVQVVALHEPLQSAAMRQQLCDAIARDGNWGSEQQRAAFVGACQSHTFTVTAKTISRLYGSLETCEPLTMALDVTIEAAGRTFTGRVARTLDHFQFVWRATVEIPTSNDDALIRAIAEAGGEYFRVEDPPYEDNVREVAWSAAPAAFRQTVDQKLADENALQEEHGGSVTLADGLYELVADDGHRIGWVVPMDFSIDDPLFDGGGLYLFYNVDGDLLVENTWWG